MGFVVGPELELLRSRRRWARSSAGVGELEGVSPGELEADDDGSELGVALGSELGVELGSELGVELESELGVALGWLEELAEGSELGVALGSELGVADGFGLCEGFCSGGGGTSQVSAAFLASSACSPAEAELPLSWALAASDRCATYRLTRTMHSGERASFTLVWGSALAFGALVSAWLRLVTAAVGSSAASCPVPRLK